MPSGNFHTYTQIGPWKERVYKGLVAAGQTSPSINIEQGTLFPWSRTLSQTKCSAGRLNGPNMTPAIIDMLRQLAYFKKPSHNNQRQHC